MTHRVRPIAIVQAVLLRELAAVRRSVEAHSDDASLWALQSGVRNAGGRLVLHFAGNLHHKQCERRGRRVARRD